MPVDIWIDVVCPFCYLGARQLSAAIAASPHAGEVDVRVHSFQLDPGADDAVHDNLERLAAKFGVPLEQAREMEQGIAAQARSAGLRYETDRPVSSTLAMHRLLQLASDVEANGRGDLAWALLEALHDELFAGSPEAFAPATLERLATGVGLDATQVREVLDSERYADAVRADHETAVRLGARGVPFTVVGERIGVAGAVGAEQFAAALGQAREQAG